MMYPFMTLNDETEIVHSDMNADGTVKVYIETPDKKDGYSHSRVFPEGGVRENDRGGIKDRQNKQGAKDSEYKNSF